MAYTQDAGGFTHASVGVHELQDVLVGDVAFGAVAAGYMTPVLFSRRGGMKLTVRVGTVLWSLHLFLLVKYGYT